MTQEWRGFKGGAWESEVNVRDFIQKNYTPYDGDDSFLEGPTQDTKDLWKEVLELSKQEREAGGVLDMDTKIISTITSHQAAYLDREKEKIVGFQTDKPFKRALQPNGGIRMAIKACEDNGYTVDPEVVEYFTTHRKTHNAGVFDAYTPEMRACRSSHIITGLPDAYGRGRIIGDYRRPALYGVDRLIEDKEAQKAGTRTIMYSDVIREREELSEQIAKNVKRAGEYLRLRHLKACRQSAGGDAGSVFFLSCGGEGAERRGDEPWPHLYLSGYLCAERFRGGDVYGGAGSGDCRSVYYEASDDSFCTHAGI